LRADFAPEIWSALGYKSKPSLFINTELYVSLGVVLVSAMTHYFKQHWRALFFSLFYCLLGFLIGLFSLLALQFHLINPFVFMILLGIGLYLPYVAIHNTVFERILSISTVPGNIGFLMYWADSIGYAGYMILIAFQFFSGYSLGEWTTLIHLFWIFGAMGLLMIICSIFVLNQKYRHGER
jgi:hypothetical protein